MAYPVLIVEPDDERAERYKKNLGDQETVHATSTAHALRLLNEGNRYAFVCIAGNMLPPAEARSALSRARH